MKTTIISLLLLLGLGCSNTKTESLSIMVLSDKTDPRIPKPQITHINHFMNDINYAEARKQFFFQTITHTSVNAHYKAELGASSFWENKLTRKRSVKEFEDKIASLIKEHNAREKSYNNSSIVKPLIEGLSKLQQTKSSKKVALLYSDIFEASDLFNVYKTKHFHLLFSDTKAVISHFASRLDIPKLKGVELYIIYYPKEMKDNRLFEKMIEVYKGLFKDSGLQITVGIPNTIP